MDAKTHPRLQSLHPPIVVRHADALCLGMAVVCLLSVVGFHFPEFLTTPELRRRYSVEWLRHALLVGLFTTGMLACCNLLRGRHIAVNMAALVLLAMAVTLGGHQVPVDDFADGTPYLALDWTLLDLVISAGVFATIEFLSPRPPPVFRPELSTDLCHFVMNHLLSGVVILVGNTWIPSNLSVGGERFVHAWPLPVQVVVVALIADLVQYGIHRAYHRVPLLWRFHAIHHSASTLDWLAGSRIHVVEMVVSRVIVLIPIHLIGFSSRALAVYVAVVGFHAVLIHSNVRLPVGPLRYIVVTPEFHHWHHARDARAIDRNFALHFPFIDALFGTRVDESTGLPTGYGVHGVDIPDGFLGQLFHPFSRARPSRPSACE